MSYKSTKDTIDKIKKTIDSFGKLTIEQKKKINYKFRLEWNFNSNSMEGNTLTIEETRSVMIGNITIHNKPLKDVLEIKGHDQVITDILHIGSGELKLSEKRIKEIHSGIMYEDDETKKDKIGKWKVQPNEIINSKGEKFTFVAPELVPERMHNLLNKTNASIDAINNSKKNAPHPIDVAMEFHLEYLEIHPFYDGNGRTARILTNLILISLGYNPFWINEKDREIYYNYISDIQGYGGDKNLLFEYCAGLIESSERLVLNAIQNIDIDDEDDLQKEIILFKKQLINKKEILTNNELLIAQKYQSDFKKLFNHFLEKMNIFNDLFVNNIIINIIDVNHITSKKLEHLDQKFEDIINCSKLSKEELNPLNMDIGLQINFKGSNTNSKNPFNSFSVLKISFNEYNYSISECNYTHDEEVIATKLYSESITDQEIKKIVKKTVSKQFQTIKLLSEI